MSVKLNPVNKMLFIERISTPKNKPDEFGFVLPERHDSSKHIIVTLKAASEGSQYERYVGQKIVVARNMIDSIEVKGSYYDLVSETGVMAIVSENELF